jgi:type IV secretory pathway ATPase VirB11/archaellum biosynthesis ATPase
VLRKLNAQIPTIVDLNLPEVVLQAAKEKTGLVLLTGATGSGKSTTLAALIEEINSTKPIHVITLEDPVEFIYTQKMATINQRELGTDFDCFSNGLRAALRQAPKVILVGEMRDRATVEIALSAAETGHLVFSTLHTIDAGQTKKAWEDSTGSEIDGANAEVLKALHELMEAERGLIKKTGDEADELQTSADTQVWGTTVLAMLGAFALGHSAGTQVSAVPLRDAPAACRLSARLGMAFGAGRAAPAFAIEIRVLHGRSPPYIGIM